MAKISIKSQIEAVELMLVNRRGHIENLERLVGKKQREPVELAVAKQPVEALEAAVKTLKWLEKNETKIKSALS
jgi:gamma-glutamyl phosphate reductase